MAKFISLLLCLLLSSCVQTFNQRLTSQDIYNSLQSEGRVGLYINFKTNSSELHGKSIQQIGEVAKALKKTDTSQYYILVVGHTDSRGGRDYNKLLSLNRAATVVNMLIDDYGFSPEQLRWEGKGEAEPVISPERTARDRFINRRVEIVLVKK